MFDIAEDAAVDEQIDIEPRTVTVFQSSEGSDSGPMCLSEDVSTAAKRLRCLARLQRQAEWAGNVIWLTLLHFSRKHTAVCRARANTRSCMRPRQTASCGQSRD